MVGLSLAGLGDLRRRVTQHQRVKETRPRSEVEAVTTQTQTRPMIQILSSEISSGELVALTSLDLPITNQPTQHQATILVKREQDLSETGTSLDRPSIINLMALTWTTKTTTTMMIMMIMTTDKPISITTINKEQSNSSLQSKRQLKFSFSPI